MIDYQDGLEASHCVQRYFFSKSFFIFLTPSVSVLIGLSKEECILPSTYGSFSGKPAQSISKSFRIKDEIMEIFDHFLQMTVSGTLPNVHKSKVLAAAKPDLTNAACR